MLNKLLIFIIIIIIIYDLYLTWCLNKKDNVIKNNKKINVIKDDNTTKIIDKNKIYENLEVITKSNITSSEKKKQKHSISDITKIIDIYGEPTTIKENEYNMWEFTQPNPWTKIIYKYNNDFPFYFFIKIKIASLNDYINWKNIIVNLEFDPKPGELIIPTKDEESALAIANLIISNFNGDIALADIINQDLISISITKIKKYKMVKNKIKEQIINSLNSKKLTNKNMEYQQDLALMSNDSSNLDSELKNNSKSDSFIAWEGSEYAFI